MSANARSYAEAAATWAPESWWALERAALNAEGAEKVHDAVMVIGPAEHNARMRSGGGGCFLGLLSMLSLIMPAVALGFLLFAEADLIADLLVPLAIAVGVGCLILAAIELRERFAGKHTLFRAVAAMAVFVSVPAAVGGWLIWSRVQSDSDDSLWSDEVLWTVIPFAAMAIIPLGLMFAGTIGAPTAKQSSSLVSYLEQQVAEMPPGTVIAVRDDLGGAVDVLERKRLITSHAAAQAKVAPIGQLGLTMAPAVARKGGRPGDRASGSYGVGGSVTPI